MNHEIYVYLIVALLPLSALILVLQVNPYNALILRGLLGAIAALVYSILGAADVALTEALVGTMLAITLYAVAVRSSLVMRLGVLKDESPQTPDSTHFLQLMDKFRGILSKLHMRLELVPYSDPQTLHQALMTKEIQATCTLPEASDLENPSYLTVTRIPRIYELLQSQLSSADTTVTYLSPDSEETHK